MRQIVREKQSGKSTYAGDQLQRCIEYVREGDALVVTKLDRLARSTLDLEQIAQLLQQKNVYLTMLDQKELDTTTRTESCCSRFLVQLPRSSTSSFLSEPQTGE